MKALEKLAQSKGLVKPEEAPKKTAAKKLDLSPSENLLDNILRLSAGLRSQGFHKHADDLEKSYLQFKQADSLYETSKETGDDLVDQAHPKGSHKLEGVEGDAVVETIVDAKKKIEEIANKKPTGKLTTASAILNAVKVILAQDNTEEAATKFFVGMINEATGVINSILRNEDLSDITYHDPAWSGVSPTEEATGWLSLRTTKGHIEGVRNYLNELARKNPDLESINAFKRYLNTLVTIIQKASNISANRKTTYTSQIRMIYTKADKALAILRGEVSDKPVAPATEAKPAAPAVDPLVAKITSYLGKLTAYEGVISSARGFTPQERKQGLEWIKSEKAEFEKLQNSFNSIKDEEARKSVYGRFEKEVNELSAEVDQFYKDWIA